MDFGALAEATCFGAVPMLAISAFTLEALLVIAIGEVAVLIFAGIVVTRITNQADLKKILWVLAVSLAFVVMVAAITWASVFTGMIK